MQRIAARIAKLGWHIVVYFEHADLDEMEPFLNRCRPRWCSITWRAPT